MNTKYSATSKATSSKVRYLSWTLQILAAAVFLAAGGAKLAGVPMMVAIFDQIGVGQWFRVVTGLVEVICAIALLVPSMAAFGGLLLATTMVAAVLIHLFLIGGSPLPAAVLFVVTATVALLNAGKEFRWRGRQGQAAALENYQ